MAERTSLRDYQRELAERLRSGESGRTAAKLGVRAGQSSWLINLADAGEVVPVPPVTPVPLTHGWFRGVANIRGRLYGIVDFSAFAGGEPASLTDQSRLLLIGERHRIGAALLIDRSLGLRNPEQLRPQPVGDTRRPWVKAEFTDSNGGHWTEIDIPQLVQDPEFLGAAG